MVRPKRLRHITSPPTIQGFKPEGVEPNGESILTLEEYEAIRLIDYDGMDQSQAAEVMNVSRQTFGRILRAGRFILSQAVVEGKCLKVEGGCYTIRQKTPRHNRPGGRGQGRGGRQNMHNTNILQGDDQMNNNSGQGSGRGRGQGQAGSQGRNKSQGCGTGQGRGKGRGQGCGTGQGQNQGNGPKNRQ